MTPTIYLTNWSSRSLWGPHGHKVYTIMAAPRRWERGEGKVHDLTPDLADLRAMRSGAISFSEYRDRFHALRRGSLAPGFLSVDEGRGPMVCDGDTLLCACSRAAAAAGQCHRTWASRLLVAAGWRVILDGAGVLP